jgi:hypothetical protein
MKSTRSAQTIVEHSASLVVPEKTHLCSPKRILRTEPMLNGCMSSMKPNASFSFAMSPQKKMLRSSI